MKKLGIRLTQEVAEAINEELAYIESLTEVGRTDEEDHGVAGQLVTLDVYTRKALDSWANNAGDEESLGQLRKVASIAVRALVLYGCPRRMRD